MDSGGGLHVYDAALNVVVDSDLRNDPRVVDHFRTIDTDYWGEFKSQVRAVDVAPEGQRYLFTLADEAWCCNLQGGLLWGVVMPLNEGWQRVVERTKRVGVSGEVEEALRLFGLSLPVSPTDIKMRYRALALTHHPDRNPGDPFAGQKMGTLNDAFEVLTGVDPNSLGLDESDTTYFRRTEPDHVFNAGGWQISVTTYGGSPQDWVYAASFAAANGGTYVATYSGKVILLSHDGRALCIYDIGTCPHEIVDVGRYTYFLTHTRLYVIEDGHRLASLLDVFRQGQLVVTQYGFGLLTGKKLQWFAANGAELGEVSTRDPIRMVYPSEAGAVVETRQHRVVVAGLWI